MQRRRRRLRVPKWMKKQNGKLRSLPPDGRCRVCGAALTRGPTAYVCGNPRCAGSPLVTRDQVGCNARRMILIREQWPGLIDD